MNGYRGKRALVESALIAGMTSLFVIIGMYIPVLSLMIILLPMPFIILASRQSIRYASLGFIVTSLLVGFLMGIYYTLFVLLVFGPMTLAMGYYINKKKEPFTVIGLGAAASIVSTFLMIQVMSIIGGVNVIDEMSIMLGNVLDHQVEMLMNMNIETVNSSEMLNYIMMIFPGILIIQSMVGAFVNYYLASVLLRRFSNGKYEALRLSSFTLPSNIVLGSFIIFTLTLLTRYIEGIYHQTLLTNVTLIFVFVFFLQGIAFVSFLLKKMRINSTIRGILLIVLVLISPLLTVISLAGLADALFDLRGLKKKIE